MSADAIQKSGVKVSVMPGICGLECLVAAQAVARHRVAVHVEQSDCNKVRAMSEKLAELSFVDVLAPLGSNVVYKAANEAGVHASCLVPSAVLKACEVAQGLALPQDAGLNFEKIE